MREHVARTMTDRTPTSASPRALIIGGSLSGLLAGLLLRRAGWDVAIHERALEDLAGRGAGIVTHLPLWRALAAAGIDPRHDLSVEIATRRMFDTDGRCIGEVERTQTVTAWDRLYTLLRSAFPDERYHAGKELVRIEQDAETVTAIFRDGTRAGGDLLVGCDGLRSTVRAQFLPDVRPHYARYVAWRGLVPEAALAPDLHAALFTSLSFCLPPGEQILGYPVAGPNNDLRAGHRRYNLVWYRPADCDELRRLLTDDTGVQHELSIPPPAVSRAAIAEMRAAANEVLAPQFRRCWETGCHPFVQPIYDLQSPILAFGRVVLIGDAALVARPHCGIGVTKAAGDAETLVASLAAEPDVAAGLRRHETVRLPFGERVIAQASRLGAYLEARPAAPAAPLPIDVVLRETATIDFLERG